VSRRRITYIALGVVALTLSFVVRDEHAVFILDMIIINSTIATSVAIIMRTNRMSLAQAALTGIGAFATSIFVTRFGLNFWAVMPISIVMAGAVGLGIGMLSLRLAGFFFAIATIAFNEIFFSVMRHVPWGGLEVGIHPIGSLGIYHLGSLVVDFGDVRFFYYPALLLLAIALYVSYRLQHSTTGSAITALGGDEILARSLGINSLKYRLIACVVASALAGAAGCLHAYLFNGVAADSFTTLESVTFLIMAILGGSQVLAGPVVGAAIMTAITTGTRMIFQLGIVMYGVILLVIVYLLPQGIIPRVQAAVRSLSEK